MSAVVLALVVLSTGAPAYALRDRIEVEQASLDTRDDGYYFDGDFDFDLKPRVAEALERGLTLYFVVEAELTACALVLVRREGRQTPCRPSACRTTR